MGEKCVILFRLSVRGATSDARDFDPFPFVGSDIMLIPDL
jgi:hypothetical protein